MNTIEELNTIGKTAVRRLRRKKHESGKPFLIWSNELPENQSYLEFPDHSIQIVTVSPDLQSFHLVRKLTQNQAKTIRQRLELL